MKNISILLKKNNKSSQNLPRSLRPFSMEEYSDYIDRFVSHPEMIELFPSKAHRIQMADFEFAEKWKDAQVTVTKLDGTRFFID